MSDEVERLKMIFSSQGPEALDKAMQKLSVDSPILAELKQWRKTFEDES